MRSAVALRFSPALANSRSRVNTKLTLKQEKFAQAYIRLMNASAAYREVYAPKTMSAKTINEAASRLVASSKVSARVTELREVAVVAAEASIERTAKEVSRAAYADVEEPIRWPDKLSALDKLMRHLGMFEKDNAQSKAQLPVQINIALVGPK